MSDSAQPSSWSAMNLAESARARWRPSTEKSTEGSRGALGHWIEIKDKKIANYQAVVPTTWNVSPMDDKGQHGPIEQALIGTKVKDEKNPFEIVRIIRSFDPCLACAIHVVTPKGREIGQYRVV